MKETDLFKPVKEWLEDKGWTVYAEVAGANGVADIVATQGPLKCVVEMKTTLSHDVIDQIFRWRHYGHYKYIAVPARKKNVPRYLKRMFEEHGIGVLFIREVFSSKDVEDVIASRFKRAVMHDRWELYEEQKDFSLAGSSGGAHWTPYKNTIGLVKAYLKRERNNDKEGWVSINDILNTCETHYARPKPSLSKSLRDFENDWCETKVMMDEKRSRNQLHFRVKRKTKGNTVFVEDFIYNNTNVVNGYRKGFNFSSGSKLIELVKAHNIVKIVFPDNASVIDYSFFKGSFMFLMGKLGYNNFRKKFIFLGGKDIEDMIESNIEKLYKEVKENNAR